MEASVSSGYAECRTASLNPYDQPPQDQPHTVGCSHSYMFITTERSFVLNNALGLTPANPNGD